MIEGVEPEIDGGRFAAKRIVGDEVVVETDIFADGHDAIAARLLHRREADAEWAETPMEPLGNDRWRGAFTVLELGRYLYTIEAWVDPFATWRHGLDKKVEAGLEVDVDLQIGGALVQAAAERAAGADAERLRAWASTLRGRGNRAGRLRLAQDEALDALMRSHPDRRQATSYGKELSVLVLREKARFSAWYEMFPRSCSPDARRHGTFRDVEARLPYVAAMGFDVLYLPPIHPIGDSHRKGTNNGPVAEPGAPGSPWAIGSAEGGHTAIHRQLGTIEEFQHLVAVAREHGLEIALDLAFQCSPDHPYVAAHPEWFRQRPDGTVQYAENPPKKYEDIYPFDFDTAQWQGLWEELYQVTRFWIGQGVRIFRVDNPHTKPFRFWEWLIGRVQAEHPEVIWLSEAFTRPKVMHHLAKLGFSQSYTYFAWRNTAWDLTQYFTEITSAEARQFFRPHLWPNTPDILTEYLQTGGRPAFIARLVLAATLGASYGIYGPAFELGESAPREPGSEEYLNSEKYEIRRWEIERPDSLKELIARVNRIRRQNPPLQRDEGLSFHAVDNDQLICYSKHLRDGTNTILVAVNLDPHHTQSGWVNLPLDSLGLEPREPFQAHDLLSDARYLWQGSRNYVELNPQVMPAHIFRLRRRVATERDFDYYQ